MTRDIPVAPRHQCASMYTNLIGPTSISIFLLDSWRVDGMSPLRAVSSGIEFQPTQFIYDTHTYIHAYLPSNKLSSKAAGG